MRVAVVGGGVVGLSCGFALRRGGADVVVYERGRVGEGCSRGNTGWICPGLSAPLPAPGVMGEALRGMLHRNSPLLISPFLGPSFLRWSWGFWRACSPERYRAGLEATVALTRSAFSDYDELRHAGVEFELHSDGLLVAALTQQGLDEYAVMLREAEEAGYEGPVRVVSGEEARELDPALSSAVMGGVHAPSERYVRPESVSKGLAAWLRANGGAVEENTAVESIEELDADAVVVAAGAWSGRLLDGVARLPMEAAKGYSVTATGSGTLPRQALYLAEGKVGTSTFGSSLRIAGIFDLTGIDERLRKRRIDAIVRSSEAYLKDWAPEEIELEWAGLRPYPPDGLPVIGSVPGRKNLFVASGHGRMGITLGPVTGKLIAQVILAGASPPELEPFRIERFSR
ncbi:MAG: FAD-dependent oxidoreductase [Gaiellaceae bacterium]